MKKLWFVLCVGLLPQMMLASGKRIARPNIVYVFPDQFRNSAMGIWREEGFSEHVNFRGDPTHTPNINKFARQSMEIGRASCRERV